jgi:hypothetical protein
MTAMLVRLALVVAIAVGIYDSSIAKAAILCGLAVLVWITGRAVQFISLSSSGGDPPMNRELRERAYRALSMAFNLLADVQKVSPDRAEDLVIVERELLRAAAYSPSGS